MTPCTCGEAHPHEVMQRTTVDGKHVCLWSDGAVTAALGRRIPGVPVRRPRTTQAQALALKAGRRLLEWVSVYSFDDLPARYRAAETSVQGDGRPDPVRSVVRAPAYPKLDWTVTRTDRDGKPTERQARLSRMWWPGLMVFDYCGGPGSKNGRYVLMSVRSRDGRWDTYCEPTGLAFATIEALWAHLRSYGAARSQRSQAELIRNTEPKP